MERELLAQPDAADPGAPYSLYIYDGVTGLLCANEPEAWYEAILRLVASRDERERLGAAARADWAPISIGGKLEDRASYRYHWQVLERAHHTGRQLPKEVQGWFAAPRH